VEGASSFRARAGAAGLVIGTVRSPSLPSAMAGVSRVDIRGTDNVVTHNEDADAPDPGFHKFSAMVADRNSATRRRVAVPYSRGKPRP